MKNHLPLVGARNLAPHFALLGSNLLWAMDYPLYHLLLPHYLPPLALLAAALLMTALWALLPLLHQKPERIAPKDLLVMIGAALLIGILHKGCLMYGLSRTSPIDGSIINTAGPLVVLLLSVAAGVDRLTRWKVVGLTLGLTGAVGVILWGGNEAHEKSDLIGNLLVLCGVLSTALYAVWLKGTLDKYRVTTVLMWVYSISALLILPFGIDAAREIDFSLWNRHSWSAFLGVMLLLTYLPNWLFNFALQRVKPMETSIYSYLQPIVAISVSVMLGLDRPQWDTFFFALVVFAGIGLVLFSYRKTSPAKADPREA